MKRAQGGAGGVLDFCTCLTLLEESLVMSQSVCLSSCIHRSVTYCRPPDGDTVPDGAAVGWDPVFWRMYSSHWTAAIYNLHLKIFKSASFFSFFFHFSCFTFLTHLWHFRIDPQWQPRLRVTFKSWMEPFFAFFCSFFNNNYYYYEVLSTNWCKGPVVTLVFVKWSRESYDVEWRHGKNIHLEKHCR